MEVSRPGKENRDILFHLLIQIFPEHYFKDEEMRKRCKAHYGEEFEVSDEQIVDYRGKLSSLANYMNEIKQAFSWYHNQRHNRRGTLWGERFKSVIVENGETPVKSAAPQINPLRCSSKFNGAGSSSAKPR